MRFLHLVIVLLPTINGRANTSRGCQNKILLVQVVESTLLDYCIVIRTHPTLALFANRPL